MSHDTYIRHMMLISIRGSRNTPEVCCCSHYIYILRVYIVVTTLILKQLSHAAQSIGPCHLYRYVGNPMASCLAPP